MSYKRLERGVFRIPTAAGERSIEIDSSELLLMLEGIDLQGAKRQRRFSLNARA